MTDDRRSRSPVTRAALSAAAVAAAMGMGGCIIIDADRWHDDSDHWGHAEHRQRQMIGVHSARVSDSLASQTGVDPDRSTLITRVFAGKPAATAGLERYDIVVAINGNDSAAPRRFREAILDTPRGQQITFTVVRKGERRDVAITPQSAASLTAHGADDY